MCFSLTRVLRSTNVWANVSITSLTTKWRRRPPSHEHSYFITRSTNVTAIRVSVTISQPLVSLTKRAHRSRPPHRLQEERGCLERGACSPMTNGPPPPPPPPPYSSVLRGGCCRRTARPAPRLLRCMFPSLTRSLYIYIYIHIYIYVYIYVCVYVFIYIYIYMCVCVCVCVCISTRYIDVYIYIYKYKNKYIIYMTNGPPVFFSFTRGLRSTNG